MVQVVDTSPEGALRTAAALSKTHGEVRVSRHADGNYATEAAGGVAGADVHSPSRVFGAKAPSVIAALVMNGTELSEGNTAATYDAAVLAFLKAHPEATGVSLKHCPKPTLLVRIAGKKRKGDAKLNNAVVRSLKAGGATVVNTVMKSRDVPSGMIVAHYTSTHEAMAAATQIRTSKEHGKVTPSLVESGEHSVKLSGVPAGTALSAITDLFTSLTKSGGVVPSRVVALPFEEGAVAVVYASEEDANIGLLAAEKHHRGGSKGMGGATPVPTAFTLQDTCVEITYSDDSMSDIAAAAIADAFAAGVSRASTSNGTGTATCSAVGATLDSNRSVLFAFSDLTEAIAAKKAAIGAGVVGVQLAHPSFSVEVTNLDADTPAADIYAALAADPLAPRVLGIDRSGLVKYRRSAEVVPALKRLKGVDYEGSRLRPVRFSEVAVAGTSEYDVDGGDEHFDRFSLERLLRDCMDLDPATRFAIARNAFERAMSDTKAMDDVRFLLTENAPDMMREKANKILNSKGGGGVDVDALFELYIQRDDMRRFTHDFKELRSVLGSENHEDAFDWSMFQIEVPADVERLARQYRKELASLEEQGEHQGMPASLKSYVDGTSEYLSKGDADSDDKEVDALLRARGDELANLPILKEKKISLGDITTLSDEDRYQWSGVVLDQDAVQHTMRGGRVYAARALVMLGNLRGSGGFGVGKAQSPAEAVQVAFREALRNLVHVDLYDNFGLAHDLYGKHNNCRAYIRATPVSRNMVGSSLSCAILERMGVASASVKLVGRRDPYAQVRSIFAALKTHENIDEFARDRGQRYMTLKWAYDNKV
jgi:small subunit ribosomal protein S5